MLVQNISYRFTNSCQLITPNKNNLTSSPFYKLSTDTVSFKGNNVDNVLSQTENLLKDDLSQEKLISLFVEVVPTFNEINRAACIARQGLSGKQDLILSEAQRKNIQALEKMIKDEEKAKELLREILKRRENTTEEQIEWKMQQVFPLS